MKRLSNKKYKLTGLLWFVVVLWVIGFIILFAGMAKSEEPTQPFCKMWNTMGDEPEGEPLTARQRKMFHLGYWLTKEEFVRINLNQHFGDDDLLVDRTVTCYTENAMFLVEETDDICQCSEEDKSDQVLKAFNAYINDCVREAKGPSKEK